MAVETPVLPQIASFAARDEKAMVTFSPLVRSK
jgi:hypothetical protein